MTKLKPLHDNVVIRQSTAEEKVGSIIVPDNAKDKPTRGEVLAVGSGRWTERGDRAAMVVKAGDVVVYSQYAGIKVKVDGEEVVVLHETEILGILET